MVDRSISRASKVLETFTGHGVSVIEPCRHELHVLETASPTGFRTKSMLDQPRVSIARLLKLDLHVTLLIRHALNGCEERLGYVRMRLLGLQFMCECYYRVEPYSSMQTLDVSQIKSLSRRWANESNLPAQRTRSVQADGWRVVQENAIRGKPAAD